MMGVNSLIWSGPTHLVAVFKDHLILDDINEFLRRFYRQSESLQRLPSFIDYYQQQVIDNQWSIDGEGVTSIRPNYVNVLDEA
jgi:hypothetical protein